MQISTILPVSILLSLVAAQSSSVKVASSACPAQPVLEACLASTQAIAAACSSTDYNCLCESWGAVLTCYLQCPNDPRQPSALSSKETYCNDASVYTSSTTQAISRSVAPVSTSATATDDASGAQATTAGGLRVASGTNTQSTAGATKTPNSAGKREMAGGLVMGVVGLVGALL